MVPYIMIGQPRILADVSDIESSFHDAERGPRGQLRIDVPRIDWAFNLNSKAARFPCTLS